MSCLFFLTGPQRGTHSILFLALPLLLSGFHVDQGSWPAPDSLHPSGSRADFAVVLRACCGLSFIKHTCGSPLAWPGLGSMECRGDLREGLLWNGAEEVAVPQGWPTLGKEWVSEGFTAEFAKSEGLDWSETGGTE